MVAVRYSWTVCVGLTITGCTVVCTRVVCSTIVCSTTVGFTGVVFTLCQIAGPVVAADVVIAAVGHACGLVVVAVGVLADSVAHGVDRPRVVCNDVGVLIGIKTDVTLLDTTVVVIPFEQELHDLVTVLVTGIEMVRV